MMFQGLILPHLELESMLVTVETVLLDTTVLKEPLNPYHVNQELTGMLFFISQSLYIIL